MRRIVLIVTVLLLVGSARADVEIALSQNGRVATIGYDASGEGQLVRAFALDITGRAVGSEAESGVKNLEQRLSQSSHFATLIKTVNVPTYRADRSKDASREDRVFSVVCSYEAVKFE